MKNLVMDVMSLLVSSGIIKIPDKYLSISALLIISICNYLFSSK